MKASVICFSDAGARLSLRIADILGVPTSDIHSTSKFAGEYGFSAHAKVSDDVGDLFREDDALIFVCACGIAVRSVAPYLKDKTSDPAVIVIDDQGRYVIPILSGHIGGANDLARFLAERISALPVITTATDGSGRFSCDSWAVKHGCAISSMDTAKKISAEILVRDIPVCSEYPLPDILPAGLFAGDSGDIGIYIGIKKNTPYRETLRLIPKIVSLGIGCRRGISKERIYDAVTSVFADNGLDTLAVRGIASIDVKKDEIGLTEFARDLGVPAAFYSAGELDSVEGEFEESEFVRKTVGVGNVCERAAAFGGGKLIVRKTAVDGVTVAAAAAEWRVEF